MASSLEFTQFTADQLRDGGEITYKKMFGEYGLYCDGIFFATVEGDQLYVKITEAGREFMPDATIAEPHKGSKAFLIEDLDDREFLKELTVKTCAELLAKKKPAKLDYKKEYKELYMPKKKPVQLEIPPMNFIVIDGCGAPGGEAYQSALSALYALTFAIKMSKMKGDKPEGYFEYVVPPLEGVWWADNGSKNIMETDRDTWRWSSMIRQPEFVNESVFLRALESCKKNKPEVDVSKAEFRTLEEGLCVQMMHVGSYDSERVSFDKMEQFMVENNLERVPEAAHKHREIYISDPRKTKEENRKTVLRYQVRHKKND